MGSYAYTCAASGLPIECGDRVRYFLLTQNPYDEGHYIYGNWFARTFPLKAKYNDYGGVMDVETGIGRDLWIDGFKSDLIERPHNDNKEPPIRHNMSFDELLEGIKCNRILVKREAGSINDKALKVDHAMIREDVWQKLLGMTVESYNGSKIVEIGVDAYKDGLRATLKKLAEDDYSRLYKKLSSRLMMLDNIGDGAWHVLKSTIPFAVGLDTHFQMMMENNTLTEEFIDTAAEFSFIHDVLAGCRFQWRPSNGSGPQDGEFERHEKMLNGFAEIARDARIAKEKKYR